VLGKNILGFRGRECGLWFVTIPAKLSIVPSLGALLDHH
jgi:hypothetical protein